MEHCTTRFFEECDADSDNYIALEEWAACFGVKERECPPGGADVPAEGQLPPLTQLSSLCFQRTSTKS